MIDEGFSDTPRAKPRGRPNGRLLAAALVGAVVLGGAASLWAAERLGWVEIRMGKEPARILASPIPSPMVAASTTVATPAQTALGDRMADLETRMTRLTVQAEAASGNAARAESLLIAAAARRAIERGTELGYLTDQLKLRFGNAQPNAVQTLIEVSAQPVTLDVLEEGLIALEPTLVEAPSDAGALARIGDELSRLFVVRRAAAPSPAPARRLERARTYLRTGRVEAVIAEVEQMPGRAAAREWVVLAQRHVRAQRALDLIETAAILESRQLIDGSGAPIPAPAPRAATGPAPQTTF